MLTGSCAISKSVKKSVIAKNLCVTQRRKGRKGKPDFGFTGNEKPETDTIRIWCHCEERRKMRSDAAIL